jgi:hypothetical protein
MSTGVIDSRPISHESSEQEPLLPKTHRHNSELEAGEGLDVDPGATQDDFGEGLLADPKPEPTQWTALSIAFYVLLAAFGVCLLVIVIKGFMDAKDPSDVDVWFFCLYH